MNKFSSVTQSYLTLCNPMDWSTPGFAVLRQLLQLAQTQVLWVSDAIQPSHLLSFPSPPAFNLSQHQRLFQWVSSSHQVAKVLELQLQHPQWLRQERICQQCSRPRLPELGRSPGGGNGNPLQYSYLENSVDSPEEPGGLQFIDLQRVGRNYRVRTWWMETGTVRWNLGGTGWHHLIIIPPLLMWDNQICWAVKTQCAVIGKAEHCPWKRLDKSWTRMYSSF